MRSYRQCFTVVVAGLLACGGALAKDVKTDRYHDSGDVLFFEQPAAGGNVVRFVPRSRTTVTYLSTVPTSGGGQAKLWRIRVGLDFSRVDAAKVKARAANPAWAGLPFLRDAVTTGGCRLLLSGPDIKLVTPPPAGPYEVLADHVCDLEVATRSGAVEAQLSQLAAQGKLVDTGIEPYRIISGVSIWIDLAGPHATLAQAGDALQGVSRDVALFAATFAAADQLDDGVLSIPEEDLEEVMDALIDALFQREGGSYSLRDAPAVPSIDVEGARVVKEVTL